MIRAPLTARRLGASVMLASALLGVVLVGAIVANPRALVHDAPQLPARRAVAALLGRGDDTARLVIWRFRVPRVVLAAATGAALALAGALLQPVMRNPLADPYVLGVSSGAALGAVLALSIGIRVAGAGPALLAIVGAALAGLLTFSLARDDEGRLVGERLVLAGVVLSYLLAAGIMWVVSLAPAAQGQHLLFWLMGSFASASGAQAISVAACVALCLALVMPFASSVNLLAVSEEHAADAGVAVERVKRGVFVACSVLVGVAVAAAGSIGFVGLVVPHGVRLALGSDARLSLPLSVLCGACFLVVADLLSRALGELPVGVVTATCGAPCFLLLLLRHRAA
jgi:iron complex transport system permease protein